MPHATLAARLALLALLALPALLATATGCGSGGDASTPSPSSPSSPSSQGGQDGRGPGGEGGALAGGAGASPADAGGSGGASGGSGGSAGFAPAGGGTAGGGAGSGGGGPGGAMVAPYTIAALDAVRITSNAAGPNFQQANATIDWHDSPFASVKLVVDLATTCFPFSNWKSDPPPAGQSFPADCDAFDRNFEVTLDEPLTSGATPALELERAITPFGGPLHLEVDVTDIANGLPGVHDLRVAIPTWSDGAGKVSGSAGGWNVSARFEVTPGPAPRRVLAVLPLFNLSQGPGAAPPPSTFQVPAGATEARIEYRATGHGGGDDGACIGPAEEFCKRYHRLFVDQKQLEKFFPWRDDCASLCSTLAHEGPPSPSGFNYCPRDPTGDVNSVRAPRANWCPGSETPPHLLLDPSLLAPGPHDFAFNVSKIAPGGSWRVSAVFIATGP